MTGTQGLFLLLLPLAVLVPCSSLSIICPPGMAVAPQGFHQYSSPMVLGVLVMQLQS